MTPRTLLHPLLSLLTGLLLFGAAPAAAVEVVVGSLKIARDVDAQQVVSLDVWLNLAPAEVAPDLAAYQVAVTLSSSIVGGGLNPPAALPSLAHPAVIITNFTPDFAGLDDAGRLSAAAFLDAGSTPIADGAGLMQIDVVVPARVAGVYTLAVDLDPIQGTVLADGLGAPIPFSAVDGTLNVAQGVPALETPWLAALGLLLAGIALLYGQPLSSGASVRWGTRPGN